jgi:hypothetical protein
MTTTITRAPAPATGPMVPQLMLTWASQRVGGNQVHLPIGGTWPDVTLWPASPRRGTLTFLFTSRADALAAEAAHADVGVFTLTDDDLPELGMRYVVQQGGNIGLTLDPETRRNWLLSVDFEQVSP